MSCGTDQRLRGLRKMTVEKENKTDSWKAVQGFSG